MIVAGIDRVQVYVRPGVTDMRKAINGLSIIVAEQMELDPLSGALFLFCNRYRRILKGPLWDRNGFWLIQNSLCSYCVFSGPRQGLCFANSIGSIDESIPPTAVLFRKVIG